MCLNPKEKINITSEIIEVFQDIADYMEDENKFYFAKKFHCEILNFKKAYYLQNHPDIGKSMNNLARVLHRLNRLE